METIGTNPGFQKKLENFFEMRKIKAEDKEKINALLALCKNNNLDLVVFRFHNYYQSKLQSSAPDINEQIAKELNNFKDRLSVSEEGDPVLLEFYDSIIYLARKYGPYVMYNLQGLLES